MTEPRATQQRIDSPSAGYDDLRNVSPETPCPYLPGRSSRSEAYHIDSLDGEVYEKLLAQGFRRSGRTIYRLRCRGCGECRQLRIPVERFTPSKSLRRVWRRNADLRVEPDQPKPTDEKFELFQRYLESQHDDSMARTYDAFVDFLYVSPMETAEFRYYMGRRLVGVSIADRCKKGLSSVYMYFDPAYRKRSLGTFSVLWEIDYCRTHRMQYYYLGFYVAQSRTMAYKARFRPNEILVGGDRWISLEK